MQFKITGQDFYNSIQKVVLVLPIKTTSPVLNNILFQVQNGSVFLTANDLRVMVTVPLKTKNFESDIDKVLIPGKMLNSILVHLKEFDQLDFSIVNNKAIIKAKDGKYKISCDENIDDYPFITMQQKDNVFKMSSNDLMKVIGKTIFATANDELKPALTGVYFQPREKGLRAVSIDGIRLSRVTRMFDNEIESECNFIIPSTALWLLNKNLSIDTMVDLTFDENNVKFSFDQIDVICRLIEAEYPDYSNVIPSFKNSRKMIVSTKVLFDSISRVSVFSDFDFSLVKFDISNEGLKVSSVNESKEDEGVDVISDIGYSGDEISYAFNSKFLLEMLDSIDSVKVEFLFVGMNGVLLRPEKQNVDENCLMMIMPVGV